MIPANPPVYIGGDLREGMKRIYSLRLPSHLGVKNEDVKPVTMTFKSHSNFIGMQIIPKGGRTSKEIEILSAKVESGVLTIIALWYGLTDRIKVYGSGRNDSSYLNGPEQPIEAPVNVSINQKADLTTKKAYIIKLPNNWGYSFARTFSNPGTFTFDSCDNFESMQVIGSTYQNEVAFLSATYIDSVLKIKAAWIGKTNSIEIYGNGV